MGLLTRSIPTSLYKQLIWHIHFCLRQQAQHFSAHPYIQLRRSILPSPRYHSLCYGAVYGASAWHSTRRGAVYRTGKVATYGTERQDAAASGVRSTWKWFGIPWGLGIACLAALQLIRTVRRERKLNTEEEAVTWQVCSHHRDVSYL